MGDKRHLRPVRTGFLRHDDQLRSARATRASGKATAWFVYLALWLVAAVLGTASGAGWLNLSGVSRAEAATGQGVRAPFSMCFTGGGYNCVVDGDTIWLQGTKIRIADIDAPETHEPLSSCWSRRVARS